MAIVLEDSRHRGLVRLLRELVDEAATLTRGEVRLARVEIAAALRGIRTGTILVATGGVLALLGGLSLFAGFILLAGDQWVSRDRYWLAALIVTVVAAGLAAWCGMRGAALLPSVERASSRPLLTFPEDDEEWRKQRQTSGVISS
jgi:Putative Actinobacterial Holin-X, holin superfamily III